MEYPQSPLGSPAAILTPPPPQLPLMILPLPPPPVPPPVLVSQVVPSVLGKIRFPNLFEARTEANNPYFYLPPPEAAYNPTNFFEFFEAVAEANAQRHPHYLQFQSLPLDQQIIAFLSAHELPEEQLRFRWQLAFDTLFLLRCNFPQCQVFVFGSLLTGLGDVNSDVDLYVDLHGDDGRFLQEQPDPHKAIEQLRDDIYTWLPHFRCPHTGQVFTSAARAMGSRVPFLRFRHDRSGLMCDLSFGNRISVQNSKLLLFYLNYDLRVGPLMVFLRYWAKFHGISGEMEIKQYALSLIALVYFMKRQIVPSVHILHALKAKEREAKGISGNPDEIGGWDASFCDNRSLIDQVFTPSPMPQGYPQNSAQVFVSTVVDFFETIASVDLFQVVICPLVGDIIPKNVFVNLPDALKEWSSVLKLFDHGRPLCVQDPFVLNFNVGGIAMIATVKKFQTACRVTTQVLKERQGNINSLLDLLIPVP